MSHPRELLSAFLDGELGPEERLRVEQHVAACPACADELGELALVDEWARDEQVVAPEDYFESLPGRVRTRLRASAARVRPRRLVPQWAWAAAALVLVGLLIPITFLRREPQAPMASATLDPQARGKDTQFLEAVPTSAPVQATPELGKQAPPLQDRAAPAPPAEPAAKTPADIPEGFSAPPPPRTAPPVASRSGADEADDLKALGYAAEAKPDDKEEEARRLRRAGAAQTESRLEAREQQAPEAPGVAAPAAGAAASAPAPATTTGTVGGLAESERKLGRSEDRDARADAYRQPAKNGKRKAEASAAADAFATLTAARLPEDAAAARALRLRWRAFAETYPGDPSADEARVRAIEAAALAYELSGAPADGRVLADDVRDYGKRSDARQVGRVTALRYRVPR